MTISFGAEWVACLTQWLEVYTYTIHHNNEFQHIKFLNSDWYHIKPTEHHGKLYWHMSTDSQIDILNPLHPTHFICKVPRVPSPSLSDSSHHPQVFPDLDKLEPQSTSPGDQLVADLQQAPIFVDITEPTDQDQKGKSHKGYLPLNPSPTVIHKPFLACLPFPTASLTTQTMASSLYLHHCNSFTTGVGIPQVNPNVTFSQFANASTFAPPTIPLGFLSHPNPPASVLTPTDGSLKGSGPAIFNGDKTKSREFMQDFQIWWMQNNNNSAFKTPYNRIAFFLGKIQGIKVTSWIDLQL